MKIKDNLLYKQCQKMSKEKKAEIWSKIRHKF